MFFRDHPKLRLPITSHPYSASISGLGTGAPKSIWEGPGEETLALEDKGKAGPGPERKLPPTPPGSPPAPTLTHGQAAASKIPDLTSSHSLLKSFPLPVTLRIRCKPCPPSGHLPTHPRPPTPRPNSNQTQEAAHDCQACQPALPLLSAGNPPTSCHLQGPDHPLHTPPSPSTTGSGDPSASSDSQRGPWRAEPGCACPLPSTQRPGWLELAALGSPGTMRPALRVTAGRGGSWKQTVNSRPRSGSGTLAERVRERGWCQPQSFHGRLTIAVSRLTDG